MLLKGVLILDLSSPEEKKRMARGVGITGFGERC